MMRYKTNFLPPAVLSAMIAGMASNTEENIK
jgi:hypothetical protein